MTANTAPEPVESPSGAQVILFPKTFNQPDGAPNPISILQNLTEMRVAAAEESLSFIGNHLFHDLFSAGFRADDDRLNKLLFALLRCMMYKHLNLQHPLMEFIHEHIEELDPILENQLELVALDEDYVE